LYPLNAGKQNIKGNNLLDTFNLQPNNFSPEAWQQKHENTATTNKQTKKVET